MTDQNEQNNTPAWAQALFERLEAIEAYQREVHQPKNQQPAQEPEEVDYGMGTMRADHLAAYEEAIGRKPMELFPENEADKKLNEIRKLTREKMAELNPQPLSLRERILNRLAT